MVDACTDDDGDDDDDHGWCLILHVVGAESFDTHLHNQQKQAW